MIHAKTVSDAMRAVPPTMGGIADATQLCECAGVTLSFALSEDGLEGFMLGLWVANYVNPLAGLDETEMAIVKRALELAKDICSFDGDPIVRMTDAEAIIFDGLIAKCQIAQHRGETSE